MDNHIVVYRSEIERIQDEYWMEFIYSNAFWLQYVFAISFALSVIIAIVAIGLRIYNNLKRFKRVKRSKSSIK